MKRFILAVVLGALFITALPVSAASVRLSYIGNPYNETQPIIPSDPSVSARTGLTIELILPEPLAPNMSFNEVAAVSFFMRDGVDILSSAAGDASHFQLFSTDASGQITGWSVLGSAKTRMLGHVNGMASSSGPDHDGGFGAWAEIFDSTSVCTIDTTNCTAEYAYVNNQPGVWVQTTVPIPAALYLFGSALGLLGWMRRKAN